MSMAKQEKIFSLQQYRSANYYKNYCLAQTGCKPCGAFSLNRLKFLAIS